MRGDCHLALINLVLFGRATPYYHNGAMMIRDESGEVRLISELSRQVFCVWGKNT